MNCKASYPAGISRVALNSAIAILALAVTALGQDQHQFRTPRRAVVAPIQPVPRPAGTTYGNINTAQGPGAGPIGPGPGCDVFPAPASTGTAVPLSYFGPPPSTVNQSLVGPVQLLNTGQIDIRNRHDHNPPLSGIYAGRKKSLVYPHRR